MIAVTKWTVRGAAYHMHVYVFVVEVVHLACCEQLPSLHQSGHLPSVLKSPRLWDTVNVGSGIEAI